MSDIDLPEGWYGAGILAAGSSLEEIYPDKATREKIQAWLDQSDAGAANYLTHPAKDGIWHIVRHLTNGNVVLLLTDASCYADNPGDAYALALRYLADYPKVPIVVQWVSSVAGRTLH